LESPALRPCRSSDMTPLPTPAHRDTSDKRKRVIALLVTAAADYHGSIWTRPSRDGTEGRRAPPSAPSFRQRVRVTSPTGVSSALDILQGTLETSARILCSRSNMLRLRARSLLLRLPGPRSSRKRDLCLPSALCSSRARFVIHRPTTADTLG
jgi:hypothetical protein